MHEASIVKSILDLTIEISEKENINKVYKIYIRVGKIHLIVFEVLENIFNIMKQDFPLLKDAEIIYEEKEIKILCRKCNKESILNEPFFICPLCFSIEIDVLEGKELHIMKIDGEN